MPARDAATGRFTSGGSSGGVDLGSAYAKVLIDESGVDSGISSIQSKFQSLGSSLTSIGSSMTMIGAPFLAVAGLAVKAASDYEDQLAQLDAVLKSTGDASGMTRDALIDMAIAESQVTKFSKDAVLSSEDLLLTFTSIGKDVFPQATKTVLNMAQALGEDTKSAAIQLGKALQDPIKGITALRRVGVNFTDAQKAMIEQMVKVGDTAGAQKLILKELETEFGNSAEAAGGTFSGQLAILQHNFQDLLEVIGFKLMPILEQFIGWVRGAIDWFQNLDEGTQNIIIGIGAFMAALAILGPIIAAIGVGIGAIGTILGVILSPIGLVIAAIVGLYVAFQNNFLGIRDFLQPIIDSIGNFFAHFSDNIKLYGSLALLYFEYYITNPLSDFWNQHLKPAFDTFSAWFSAPGGGLDQIKTFLNDFKVNVWDKVVSAIGTIWDAVKGGFKLFSDWFKTGGLVEIRVAIDLFTTQVINPFIKDLQDIWTKVQPKLEVLKLGMKAIFDWIDTNVIQPVVNALQSIIDKVTAAVNALALLGNGKGQIVPGYTVPASQMGPQGPGPSSGVQPIPPVGGGSAAAPSGSVGVGAQGISGDTYHVTVNANDAAGGKAAGDAFTKALDDRYHGRGN